MAISITISATNNYNNIKDNSNKFEYINYISSQSHTNTYALRQLLQTHNGRLTYQTLKEQDDMLVEYGIANEVEELYLDGNQTNILNFTIICQLFPFLQHFSIDSTSDQYSDHISTFHQNNFCNVAFVMLFRRDF